MKNAIAITAVLMASLLGACGDSDDEGNSTMEDSCAAACETSGKLGCGGDDPATCVAACEQAVASAGACQTEAQNLVDCTASAAESDFVCDEFDESELKDGVCDEEGNALFTCISS